MVCMTRAAIYLRISLDATGERLAVERQREACLQLAKDRGWEIVHVYEDNSKSATDPRKRRPDYEQMVADYAAGRFDALVCWDLDRLTRQPRQLEDWIDAATERGLKLITANGEADLSTDGGRMYARIKASVARAEVERKSARQIAANHQRAGKGKPPGGVRPLGYTIDRKIIPDEAETVRMIFKRFDSGDSINSLTRWLTETGVPTRAVLSARARVAELTSKIASTGTIVRRPEAGMAEVLKAPPGTFKDGLVYQLSGGKLGYVQDGWVELRDSADEPPCHWQGPAPRQADDGLADQLREAEARLAEAVRRPWSHATVRQILLNPTYVGRNVYRPKAGDRPRNGERNDQLVYPGDWEPIIDEPMWERVNDRLKDPRRRTNRRGGPGADRKYLGGGVYRCGVEGCGKPVRNYSGRYQCPDRHLIRGMTLIDSLVTETMRQVLARPGLGDLLHESDDALIKELNAKIKALDGRLEQTERDYDDDLIDARRYRAKVDKIAAEQAILREQRKRASGNAALSDIVDADDPVAAYDAAPIGVQRTVVDTLLDVRLWPQRPGTKGLDPESIKIKTRDLKR